MAVLVVPLSRRIASDPSVTGGKGAGLARLLKAGFPVPPGFVIATAAFRRAIDVARGLALRSLPEARRFCLEWDVPAKLRRSVLEAYRRLGCGPVAVRSSLVGEDAAGASFAGQLDTVLDVAGEEALIDAVRRVLASAFGDRLWAYLDPSLPGSPAIGVAGPGPVAAAGRPSTGPALTPPGGPPHLSLAVVIQSMVPAAVSGVAFSVDPVTCRPGVVIEACPGLAEALVQGRVRPDRYRLDPRGEIEEIAPDRPGSPLLDETRVRELAGFVRAIADRAEAPRDVEWSFDGRRFFILQARPISSIAGKPVYSRRMVSDMAPGVVKPLVWSAKYAPVIQNVFAPVFEEIAGPTGLDYSRMSARLHSRVYMNVTAFGEILERIGLPANFFYMLAREDKAVRPKLRPRLGALPSIARHIRFVRRESRIGRRIGPFIETQRREHEAFRRLDLGTLSPQELIGHFERLKAVHGGTQWYVILVSINMLLRSRVLARMIVKRWPGTDPRDVIKGYGRRSSLAPFEELKALAEQARRLDADVLEKMDGGEGSDPAPALGDSEEGRALLRRFEAFMGRFGFLSANGSDFSEKPWVEDPRIVWRTIARLARHDGSGPSTAESEARRTEVLGLVRSGFGPLKRRAFDRLHASTVAYMECRESISLLMTQDSYLMRRCLLALGARLVERGTIASPDDIFYLFEDELARVLDDPAEAAAAAGRIAARKAELERDAALDPPDTLCGGEMAGLAPPTAEGLEFLSGIGASGGAAKGRARVVRDPAGVTDRFGADDILVVPFTDIGWLPVLAGIGGVVADTGGQLSHTSIIAREYGIPAVVSVRNATRLIRDGQPVTVDGTAGRVYLHQD